MTTPSALLLWLLLSAIVTLLVFWLTNRMPVDDRSPGSKQDNICLSCGRVISGSEPAICSVCAEFATEVSFPVLVRQVVRDRVLIHPSDLRD